MKKNSSTKVGSSLETARYDHGYEKPETTATQGCALAILKRKGTGAIGCTIHCGGIEAHWIQDI